MSEVSKKAKRTIKKDSVNSSAQQLSSTPQTEENIKTHRVIDGKIITIPDVYIPINNEKTEKSKDLEITYSDSVTVSMRRIFLIEKFEPLEIAYSVTTSTEAGKYTVEQLLEQQQNLLESKILDYQENNLTKHKNKNKEIKEQERAKLEDEFDTLLNETIIPNDILEETQGSVSYSQIQQHDYYGNPIVEEILDFNKELCVSQEKTPEEAIKEIKDNEDILW